LLRKRRKNLGVHFFLPHPDEVFSHKKSQKFNRSVLFYGVLLNVCRTRTSTKHRSA